MKIRFPFAFVALAALFYVAGQGAAQRSNAGRQTWEYKTIYRSASYDEGLMDQWENWWEDSKQLPGPASMQPKLAQLGDQGWELVSIETLAQNARVPDRDRNALGAVTRPHGYSFGGVTTSDVWVFKRLKQ